MLPEATHLAHEANCRLLAVRTSCRLQLADCDQHTTLTLAALVASLTIHPDTLRILARFSVDICAFVGWFGPLVVKLQTKDMSMTATRVVPASGQS